MSKVINIWESRVKGVQMMAVLIWWQCGQGIPCMGPTQKGFIAESDYDAPVMMHFTEMQYSSGFSTYMDLLSLLVWHSVIKNS